MVVTGRLKDEEPCNRKNDDGAKQENLEGAADLTHCWCGRLEGAASLAVGAAVQSQSALQCNSGPTLATVPDERFEEHLRYPVGLGHRPEAAHDGSAGGAACGDLIRFSVVVQPDGTVDAGFDAEGCGALAAAASAVCDTAVGMPVLGAATISPRLVAERARGSERGEVARSGPRDRCVSSRARCSGRQRSASAC